MRKGGSSSGQEAHKKEICERRHRTTHKRGPVRWYVKRHLQRKRRRNVEEDIVVEVAGDGLLEGGTSDGGGMPLRDCGP